MAMRIHSSFGQLKIRFLGIGVKDKPLWVHVLLGHAKISPSINLRAVLRMAAVFTLS